MLPMDMPYTPSQETPIVLAQAATPGAGATLQPDYLLKTCKDTTSGDYQDTAENGVDPAGWLAGYLDNRDQRYIEPAVVATIKLTLLQSTTHGKLIQHTSDAGINYYMYQVPQGYQGKDKAVFMAEFEGKIYKIVIDLNVYAVATLAENMPSMCPKPTLIKLNLKPASGSSGYDSGYSLGSLTVIFADLDNAAGFVGAGHAREQKEGRGHGPLLQGAVIYSRFY